MKKCPNGLENVWNRSEMVSLTLGNNIKTVRHHKRAKGLIFARDVVLEAVKKIPGLSTILAGDESTSILHQNVKKSILARYDTQKRL